MQSHLEAKMDRLKKEEADQQRIEAKKKAFEIWSKFVVVVFPATAIIWLENTRAWPKSTLQESALYGSLLLCLIVILWGIGISIAYSADTDRGARQTRERIGGSTVDPLFEPQDGDGVPIGFARMPSRAEPLHTLIEGATGTGKTQLLKQMVQFIRARGDTVVVVDTNHDLFNTFGKPGDILLSAFDQRSPGWSPANEIDAPTDWNALAETLIEQGEGSAKEWNAMARAFFAAVARGYHQTVQEAGEPFDFHELVHLLTAAPPEEVEPFLVGSAAASLGQNEKGMNNIRMSFYESLAFVRDLKAGDFSARRWVQSGANGQPRPSIFIPHTKRTLAASRTLIATWLDQIISEACDGGENSKNRVWIIIDELSSLGRIPALETAVTELRKTGFRVVVGIQNYEQIEQRYTKTGAATIGNNLSNRIIFRANGHDAAERASKLIGDARNKVTTVGQTLGETTGQNSHGTSSSTSWSVAEQVERVVLPSEILALEDLRAFVKFAGSDTALYTPIPVYHGPKTGGWQLERKEGKKMNTDMTDQPPSDAEVFEFARRLAALGPGEFDVHALDSALGPEASHKMGRMFDRLQPLVRDSGFSMKIDPASDPDKPANGGRLVLTAV